MRLLLDLGNTRLKWALRSDGRSLAHGALTHEALDALPALLARQARPQRAVGVRVAGPAPVARLEDLLGAMGLAVHWFGSTAAAAGVRNGYDEPGRLGADRWAALVGAWQRRQAPTLVVCAGTATTVDVLDRDGNGQGVFRGGLILPGPALMRRSLAQGTAGLPLAQGRFTALPCRTDDAIESGCLQAQLGAIERMFALLAGRPDARCCLAGGAAPGLLPHLTIPCEHVPALVLDGVAALADEAARPACR